MSLVTQDYLNSKYNRLKETNFPVHVFFSGTSRYKTNCQKYQRPTPTTNYEK